MSTYVVERWTPGGYAGRTRRLTTFQSLTAARVYARAASLVVSPDVVYVAVRDPRVSPSLVPGFRYRRGVEDVYNRIPGFTVPMTGGT